jgi:peptidoglycan/LPS O-acetylase OafA/YrhL
VAACMVVLFHFYTPRGHVWSLPVVQGGWLFVDFFFVLSGFVIFASYGERLRNGFPIARYMVLRIGRIYPLHFAVLAAYLAFETLVMALPDVFDRAAFATNRRPAEWLHSVLLLQTFLDDSLAWNGPAWSIAVEFWVYLLTALLFAFARRLFWPAVALLVAASAMRLALDEHYLVQVGELALYRGLYGFGLGMVAFALFRRWGARWKLTAGWASAGELVVVVAGVLFVSLARGGGWLTMLGPPAFAAGVFVFAFQAGWVSRALLVAPLRMLGILSYSIYLTHLFVLERMQDGLQWLDRPGLAAIRAHPNGLRFIDASPLAADLLAIVFLAAVVVISWLTYSLVERPAREWSRRLARRPHPPRATEAIATR